ncbi:Lon protease family protein [Candidatus Leptofilum sp.]|uniref:Lon protease family protein n=1 Tax=Candidatus Leptofilum sp. TaxID=3241576 RepID=UPI003B5BFDD8
MPKKKATAVSPLTPDQLRLTCPTKRFTFANTAELEAETQIIGQPRGTQSIAFGIGIGSHGYNIYALGAHGTGRATAIEHFLQQQTRNTPVPSDWIYVHNFAVPHQPRAIELLPGQGAKFKARMSRLIADLRQDLPQAFDTDSYRETINRMKTEFEQQRGALLQTIQQKAAASNFGLMQTASGFAIVPVQDGQQMSPEQMQQMPIETRQAMEQEAQKLSAELEEVVYQIHQMELDARQKMKQIDRDVAQTAVQHHFEALKNDYAQVDEMCVYLDEVEADVLNQIDDFTSPVDSPEAIDLSRYEVNLLVNNAETKSAPVIVETNPTYSNLFGRLEYEMRNGLLTTHFTNIKCGSLHWANGGYLILNAHDLFKYPDAWEALKRAIKSEEISVRPAVMMSGGQVMAKTLDPEPIPLQVKIIMTGSVGLYYLLFEQDEDFRSLFKVRADFDSTMPRDEAAEQAYANFIANRCHQEKLLHFDATAVAKVVEFGSRIAEDQRKLSTVFGMVADLVREASYWAGANGRTLVTAQDVQEALAERTKRANQLEELMFERFLDGTVFIATDGGVVGQVNGLSVLDTGDYSFGLPGRITARTFMGDDGIIHIERETEMSGPIHEKGVLTLNGYLGGTYAQHQPLSLTASLTFEQNYSGVDGDSASSTELYALLSSLSEIPIKQSLAVTGSVNQRGEIQPIGGVNEKIEGWFRLCAARGLTGEQGVLIPASNVENLMLHEAVVTAVTEGNFHIWPIQTLDEGIELLMGLPAGIRQKDGSYPEGTIHHAVQARLLELAEELNNFGEDDDGDDS